MLHTLSSVQSLKIDEELGKQNIAMVEQEMGIYDDIKKTAYLTKVVDRLIAKLDKPLFN
ncbi:hypothetical protein [Lutimonas sp.]|uniref:hypothetical protein n=1 Tax=Lutimonas sp. TaxID=1872403 RepID=UPI003D9ADB50